MEFNSGFKGLMLLECSSISYSITQHGNKTQETAALYIVLMLISFVKQFVEKWSMQSRLHIEKLKKFQPFLQPTLLLFLINTHTNCLTLLHQN